MKKLKLSPWHDASVNPVRKGVYQVFCRCCGGQWYSKWTGKYFAVVDKNLKVADQYTSKDRELKLVKWRGVLK